jgi:hypothetical protein
MMFDGAFIVSTLNTRNYYATIRLRESLREMERELQAQALREASDIEHENDGDGKIPSGSRFGGGTFTNTSGIEVLHALSEKRTV